MKELVNEVEHFNNGDLDLKVVVDENGDIKFDAEQVAIGLGLCETKGNKKYVIWKRVKKYLACPLLKKGSYISEEQIYILALKARSTKSNAFKYWVAYDVIPQIRKTGKYESKNMSDYYIFEDNKAQKVYLISNGVNTKIGVSKYPDKRLSQLQTGNPKKLLLIYSSNLLDNALKIEFDLHQDFKQKQVFEEWFLLSSEDILYIISMLQGFNNKQQNRIVCEKLSKLNMLDKTNSINGIQKTNALLNLQV